MRRRVLVAGSGPVGMAASLLLRNQGVHASLIDRRLKPSGHAKAHYLSMRSLEILE